MKIKKIASAIIALAMMACMSVTVFAASDLNPEEQAIIAALSQPITNAAGVERSIPDEYINNAETYFRRDGVDVSSEDAQDILNNIYAAQAAIAADDSTSAAALPQGVIDTVVRNAAAAAGTVGLTLTYGSTGGVVITDASGAVIFNRDGAGAGGTGGGAGAGGSSVIKQMGFGVNALWVVLAAIAVLSFAGYAVFARRRNAVASK